MKFYAKILILVFTIVISAFFQGCNFVSRLSKNEVFLNTASMKEAPDSVLDSLMGPSLIAVYPGKQNRTDGIPWADVFICKWYHQNITDTVLFLDTRIKGKPMKPIDAPDIYWTGIKATPKYNTCRILIPKDMVDKIRRYKYKYGEVILATDD